MATEAFRGISFTLPRAGKLKVAEDIGRRCGERWYAESTEALPVGYPDELQDWTNPCRVAWRDGLVQGWHAAKDASAKAPGRGALVGYARASTQDQHPELQLDALKAAGCARIFVEKASGAQRERPELTAALEYMRPGDTLVVWRFDRLARSLKQLIETVEGLEAQSIGFRSLTEAIDTTTGGKLVFHIFASLAEFERSIIRERTRAGLDAARARGRVGGRPPALREGDLQEARALLKNPAITVEQVAKRLGVGASTLYRHLPGGRAGV